MLEDHWFWRGFQSAVFLYVSCGPCFAAQTQRKRKQEAKRDKKRNAEMAHIHVQDGHHPQPAPFEINSHWAEEIRLGPGPPKRRGRNRAQEKREISTAGTNSTAGSSLDLRRVPSTGSEAKGQYWNSRRYQRADEEYTYFPPVPEHTMVTSAAKDAAMETTETPGDLITCKIQKPEKSYYNPARAPPVSDLHPPATSTVPVRKSERAWMMAPPPSVAFMEGRKQVTNRPRSTSARSGTSQKVVVNATTADHGTGKLLGQRAVEDRVRRGSAIGEGGRRLTLSGAFPSRTMSQSPQRGNRSLERDRTTPRKPRKRPTPLFFSNGSSSDEVVTPVSSDTAVQASPIRSGTPISRPEPTYMPLKAKQQNKRPALLTTRSSDSTPRKQRVATVGGRENSMPGAPPLSPSSNTLSPRSSHSTHTRSTSPSPRPLSPRKPPNNHNSLPRERKDTKTEDGRPHLTIKDSSLHVLQDLVEPNALLNSKWIRSPTIEAKIPLPHERDDSLTDEWLSSNDQDWIPQVRQSCEF
jgi:hypothetical protein